MRDPAPVQESVSRCRVRTGCRFTAVFLLGSVVWLASVAGGGGEEPVEKTVVVTVMETETLKPMSGRYLGYNYEWVGLQKLFPDPCDDRQAVMDRAKDIPLPFNRMSGTVSQEFSWKGAIGPVKDRVEQKLVHWRDPMKISFGPVEWAGWITSQNPDAEFTWTVNLLRDSPQDAADLVEFFTGDGSTNPNGGIDWAAKRRELGIENPLKIAVWEIGNEMDLKLPDKAYVWDSEQYIAAAGPVIKAIKSVDLKAKIALQGSSYFRRDWNERVLKTLGDKADYLVVHLYYQGGRTPEDAKGFKGHPQDLVKKWLDESSGHIRAATGSDRIKLYVSEYAQWPWQSADRPWSSNWWQSHSLEACLTTAQMVTWFLNRPGVAMANYHSFSSGPWKILYRDEKSGEADETAMADTFRLLNRMGDAGVVVPIRISGDGAGAAREGVVFAAAAVRRDRKVQVLLVNRGEARTVEWSFQSPMKVTGALRLSGPDLDSYNSPGNRPVVMEPFEVSADAAKSLKVPEHSALLFDMEIVAPGSPDEPVWKPAATK